MLGEAYPQIPLAVRDALKGSEIKGFMTAGLSNDQLGYIISTLPEAYPDVLVRGAQGNDNILFNMSQTLGERLASDAAPYCDRSIIAARDKPVEPQGGLIALFGSLAPKGAILKRSAADPKLFEHEGRAVVFSSLDDLAARMDDPALDVAPQDVLVLQNAGPHAAACMPEAGYLPIPRKLAQQGVKDMIRVSDARMSGTAFGTIVLHVTPDSASGGPLRLVRNGDRIRLSVRERRIDLLVDEAELKKRAAVQQPAPEKPTRGYAKLYAEQILGADEGCDFAFLRP